MSSKRDIYDVVDEVTNNDVWSSVLSSSDRDSPIAALRLIFGGQLTEMLQFSTHAVTVCGETALVYKAKQTLLIAELGDVLKQNFVENILSSLELPKFNVPASSFEHELKNQWFTVLSKLSYRYSFDEEKQNTVFYLRRVCRGDHKYCDFFELADLLAECEGCND